MASYAFAPKANKFGAIRITPQPSIRSSTTILEGLKKKTNCFSGIMVGFSYMILDAYCEAF